MSEIIITKVRAENYNNDTQLENHCIKNIRTKLYFIFVCTVICNIFCMCKLQQN